MNKFDGPDNANFKLVKEAIRQLAINAPTVLSRRKTGKLIQPASSEISHTFPEYRLPNVFKPPDNITGPSHLDATGTLSAANQF